MKQALFAPQESCNEILRALGLHEAARLAPHLRPREFVLGEVLAHPGQTPQEVCFIESGMLSNILCSNQNASVEVGVCGREGAWDALLVLNSLPRADRAIVQVAGWGWLLPAEVFQQEFVRGGSLQRKLLLYLDLLYTQAAVGGMCNRLHTIEERLARWLLTMRGGAQDDEFEMPAEFVASMLGSRLSGVPIALGVLQRAGLIVSEGPSVRLLDVEALEHSACECHALLCQRLHAYTQA